MADYNSSHTGAEIDTAVSAVVNKLDKTEGVLIVSMAGVGFDFYGASAPSGALSCDGQEVSKTTYALLYAAIGDVWATTGGSPTPTLGNFRLPPQEKDGLGLYNRGVGSTNGVVGTYQEDVFKEHSHRTKRESGTSLPANNGALIFMGGMAGVLKDEIPMEDTGDGTETRPRSITVLKCIWTGL